MSPHADREIEAAVPGRGNGPGLDVESQAGARAPISGRAEEDPGRGVAGAPGAWTAITEVGRRGGRQVTRDWVAGLQAGAGNAAVARLLRTPAADDRSTRRVGPTLRHAGDIDVPGSQPGAALPPGTDAPTPLDNPAQAPATSAPTTSFTKVGPPTHSSYTVSGTLRQAANAVAARPEAGATTTTPDMNMAEGSWPAHVQVTVTQAVELPEWDGKTAATQNQRNEWDRFKAAITAHENGHVATDVKAFANAHVRIKARKTRAEGNTEFDTIIAQANTDNTTFDTSNDHGRNAGTNINPNIDEVTKVP